MRIAWETVFGGPASSPLPPGLLEDLGLIAQRQDAEAGDVLLTSRVAATDLIVLVHGDLSLGIAAADTSDAGSVRFVVERNLSGPAWLDLASAWRGGSHSHDMQAASDVVLMRVPRDAMLRLMGHHLELAPRLLQCLAQQIDYLQATTRDLLHKDAEARFAGWLVQRVGDLPRDTHTTVITLAERKRDIAAQLGVTPETLSRLQRALTRKGLIEVIGYSVRLVDLPRLRELAG
jgi:CRP-like cAMP-binding protein